MLYKCVPRGLVIHRGTSCVATLRRAPKTQTRKESSDSYRWLILAEAGNKSIQRKQVRAYGRSRMDSWYLARFRQKTLRILTHTIHPGEP